MKKLSRYIYLLLISLVCILALTVFILFSQTDISSVLFPSIFRTDTTSSVESILTGTAPLKQLDITGMTVKVVFPHDLYPPDYDWKGLLRKKNYLNDEERKLLKLYNATKVMGIDLSRQVKDFLVFTFDITCSLDLSVENIRYTIIPLGSETEGNRILLSIPAPAITSVIQRDMTDEDYTYPELDISPGDLAIAVKLAEQFAIDTALQKGLILTAEEKGESILSSLMTALGFEEVYIKFNFTNP